MRATRISCKASAACGSLRPKRALADSLAPATYGPRPRCVSGNGFVECDAALALEPRTRYYWSATAWDEAGRIVCSPVDSFETAMADGGWTAKWITDRHDKNFAPSPVLRKSFTVKDGVREARLYMSAAAYGKMTVNGEPVTENKLEPGYTHYDKRNLYATYDVTKLLRPGRERRGRRARQRLLQRDSARGDMGFRGRPAGATARG